jgi:ABC-type dipeptide/oligopeptide/nickel transport system permease component
MIAVLISVSIVTFLLMHAAPGGPFDREKKLPAPVMANINAKFHLDDPLVTQYLQYMGNVLIPRLTTNPKAADLSDYFVNVKLGDQTLQWMNFGPSYKSQSRTVNDIFRDNLPISFTLGILALLVALIIGIPAGIIAALGHNRWPDFVATSIAVLGSSLPSIVLGPLLIIVFGLSWRWLPVSGWGTATQAILPVFTLGLGSAALIARLTRASLLEVLNEDYIRTARAKGLRGQRIVNVHALKNAMIPVTTVLGPLFASLVTGSFVVETVFGIPGMGKYFVSSINDRDYPVIMGTVLLFAMILVVANFLVDLAYGWLDPRIGFGGSGNA